jgi:hypothetical protein
MEARPLTDVTIGTPRPPALEDFSSLFAGGPVHRLAWMLGPPNSRVGLVRLGIAIGFLTWLPLFGLAALGQVLTSGAVIPFVGSLGTHTRLLAAIPLFFVAEALFNARAAEAIRLMAVARLVPATERARFDAAIRQTMKLCNTWVIEGGMAVVTILLIRAGLRTDLPAEITTWRTAASGALTPAGWWYTLVSLPVFQFLVWRWCVRLSIWAILLWRIGRLSLRLVPTHPDLAGGLGGLGVTHVTLAPMSFAAMAMLVASYSEQILYGGTDVRSFVLPLAGFIVGTTAVMLAPLVFFTARLLEVKQEGLLEYGMLAEGYVRAFDTKWLRGQNPSNEPLLGSADIQSLADLANAFGIVHNMRIVPIAPSQILVLALASILPALPLVLFVVPLDQLIIDGVRTVLGG